MRFLLPLHQARPHTLTLLFSQLETQAREMGVASYGLTACSMEEIFVQLTHKEAAEAPDGEVYCFDKIWRLKGHTCTQEKIPRMDGVVAK